VEITLTQSNRLENRALQRAIRFLRDAAVPCFVAGGSVRDRLLGRPSKDVDIVVETGAIPLARRLADATQGAFYVLDESTDAARVLYRKPSGDLVVDVAAMRGPDLEADLSERDFTVNAMAVAIADFFSSEPEVIDPCGGQSDLLAGVLRATSEHAFVRDPIRMLRALRFEAKLGFQIEPDTESWMRRDASLIVQSSLERTRDELTQIISVHGAADRLQRMDALGLLRYVLPELVTLQGVAQSAPHIHDVYEHTLVAVAEAERLSAFPDARLGPDEREFLQPFVAELERHFGAVVSEGRTRATLLKFAAMLHDAGKPQTRSLEPDGRIRAFGHERVGAETAEAVLNRLRFSAKEVRLVGTIVRHHMRPGWLLKSGPVTRKAIYRFFRDTGDAGIDVCILALADQLATRGPTLTREHWRDYLGLTQAMLEGYFRKSEEVVAPPPLVTGQDVMALLGLEPGPRIGELLEAVREAQAEGTVTTRAEGLELLRRL
jgi:tRNA nucleotidyltransferase/poly(A) polymerase